MNQSPPLRFRHGYTLVELLIVVAVLATVVSLAVPSLRKLSQRGQLQDAARQLRGQLLAARLLAIESASSTLFYYQPDTGIYLVTGSGQAPRELPPLGDLAVGEAVSDDAAATVGRMAEPSEQTLPSDVRFLSPAEAAVPLAAETTAGNASGSGWSEPLIFYPNGRALNARIRLASDRYWIEVTVRGLTGTVRLSPVQRLAAAADEPSEALP
ncbi:MAG: prepilin-type N-terminal cleavage/methylation domain-containing protein [Pirellulaceae bacterium]|nr:prepilin-type N-terminal cleavage/methylation domain-containing protein [Pirellulaceae bacterium]